MTGMRESEWHVLRRCLALLICLQRGPANTEELIAASQLEGDTDGEVRRLQDDIKRLREHLDCDISFVRSTGQYVLKRVGVPLMDLPSTGITGLAFLWMTFNEGTPMGSEVDTLVQMVLRLLPNARLQDVYRQRQVIDIDLQSRDQDEVQEVVWEAIRASVEKHCQLEFDYYSPGQADEIPRHHVVEPLRYYFERGHYYLRAFCLNVIGPYGLWESGKFMPYRIGRIHNPHVLPTVFIPREAAPQYDLIYELIPQIARHGVTVHFPKSKVMMQSDSSAIVYAQVESLFLPLKTLLYYGPGCKVIGGDEALVQMRSLIKAMHELYDSF